MKGEGGSFSKCFLVAGISSGTLRKEENNA